MIYCITDIETTGGQANSERIIEIAIIKHNGNEVIDTFHTLINPERPIPWFISKLTNITSEMVADAPRFFEVAKQIVDFTEGCIFVAHNVRFDYSFVKKEFHDLGFNFQRKRLCTVRLSRKLIHGQPSYSLGKLCSNLGIELKNAHRAIGDATATAELFDRMIKSNSEVAILTLIEDEIKAALIPAPIPKSLIDGLPEQTGVYFFHDQDGKVIYVGKSTNIKKRILQHFQVDLQTAKALNFKNAIADVTCEVTGSELVALLYESDLIKRIKPLYNTAQRRTIFAYGIFHFTDANGYINFQARRLADASKPLFPVSSALAAKEILFNMVEKHHLCQKLCHIYKTREGCFQQAINNCFGACIGAESAESYNARASQIVAYYSFKEPNFIIVGKGRNAEEQSVVLVENGIYQGFGYLDNSEPADFETIKSHITHYADNRDIQQILRGHLKKPGHDRVVVIPKNINT
jgi:DNA polymerase III subunit epsilon